MKKNTRLVYSTETGRVKEAKDADKKIVGSTDGVIRVTRQTKGRNGKPVSIATGFSLDAQELKSLAKNLKQICGTGGTVKDGSIEIQGDQRDKIVEFLKTKGFDAKKSGG